MLMPEYFYGKEDRLLEIYRELEDFILEDIASRLIKAGKMTATADREIWKLEQMGLHREEIFKKLVELTGKSKSELRSILQDAVMTSWKGDAEDFSRLGIEIPTPLENPAVISILDAEWRKTQGELNNLTQTTMLQSQKDLLNMLNQADVRVAAGVQSYSSAVCQILDEYAGTGLMIEYPTGTKRSLEAAVRCCVVTSINQTAAQVTNKYIAEHGIEYVLVSAHTGARHDEKHPQSLQSHDWWQGHVFKINGKDADCKNLLESTGYDIDTDTGVGRTKNMLGLHGYNCRHSHQAWQKGFKNPWVDENGKPEIDREESRRQYELEQKQRAMERAIRKTKKRLMAKRLEITGMDADAELAEKNQAEYDRLAYKLQTQNKSYNDFCKDNHMQRQYDRNKVAGFNRRQTAEANERAAVYKNRLNDSSSRYIIKDRINKGEYSLALSKQSYLKHVDGTKQYCDYKESRMLKGKTPQGRFAIPEKEVQQLIEQYSGTGEPKITAAGKVLNIEFVTVENVIGQYYSNGEWLDTKRMAVHYGKKSSHAVPVEEKNG